MQGKGEPYPQKHCQDRNLHPISGGAKLKGGNHCFPHHVKCGEKGDASTLSDCHNIQKRLQFMERSCTNTDIPVISVYENRCEHFKTFSFS